MASLQARVDAARHDDGRVVLEGVHALKHAVRFGATIEFVASPDRAALDRLVASLAPDLDLHDLDLHDLDLHDLDPHDLGLGGVVEVSASTWERLTRGGLPSPCLAVADRPPSRLDDVLGRRGDRPVVVLEDPTHLGNVGATVRVAAAAGAEAVVVVGDADPWHARAVRGGAGLQFALAVGRRERWPASPRPLVAVDPDGDLVDDLPGGPAVLRDAVLAFGSERRGLSADVLERADLHLRLPMRAGVSSLNLATSVAAVLYGPASPG